MTINRSICCVLLVAVLAAAQLCGCRPDPSHTDLPANHVTKISKLHNFNARIHSQEAAGTNANPSGQ